jgi:putative endopeptidase
MKKTIYYLASFCISIFAILFGACNNKANDAEKYKGEVHLSNFDTTVKSQQDFYNYVNGTWRKKNPVPATEAAWGSFNLLQDSVVHHLRKIMEATVADKNAPSGSTEQKVGDLYATMMDSVKLNKEGISPLKDELARIDSISDMKSLWKNAAHLMVIGPDVMFGFSVGQDAKISIKEACQVGQGGLTLPSKEYYTEDNPMMKNLRAKYIVYATKMLEQLGRDSATAAADARTVLAIETRLAEVSMDQIQLRNVDAQYNKMPMTQLEKMTPNIDWAICLAVFGINSVDTVIVAQPAFMSGLSNIVKAVPLKDWKTYLSFHLLREAASKMSDTIAQINFDFWGKTLSGLKERQPRWKRSVESTSGELGMPVGQLYVKEYFSPGAKARVYSMVKNIIEAYKQRINNVTWMSPATKRYALAKLDKIMLKLCYPDKWKDYSSLQIKRDNWVANSYRISEFEFHYDMNKLGKPVDLTEWGMSPQTVNAYYNPSMNEIVFPAAFLQPPFFDSTRDNAMNYGSIGAVIGHELTHGFDDQGSEFDSYGNLHKWWTAEDSTRFHNKLQVLIEQFDNYVIDSIHVRGKLTVGENTADLGGITIAYQALQNDLKNNPEGVVDGFTPEQRFFISFAQAWCENIRPDYQRELITTDPHSPSVLRTNGPLSNMIEFYRAFNVKKGDAMYRDSTARASIW